MGLGHSPSIVTNGLVMCLDAGNTKSYPGSGTTITDLSGSGNTGTLTNGPTFNYYDSRTNGNLYSNDVTNAYYTKSFVTTGASSETAPDGTITAFYFTLSSTSTTYKGVVGGYISYPTSSIVTISCFVKPTGGARYFWIREGSYGSSRVGFDLTSVSVFSSSNATGYINAAGNGWYRVQAVMGALPQSSARVQLLGASDTTPPGNSNVSSTGTETYHIWGAQCELGSFATSPMLTTSSTVTRGAGPATLVCDGVDDYVALANSGLVDLGNNYTISAFIKLTNTSQAYAIIFSSLDVTLNTNTKGVGFYWYKTAEYGMAANCLRLQQGTSGWSWNAYASDSNSIADTNWHFVSLTVSNASTANPTVTFSVDGVAKTTTFWNASSKAAANYGSSTSSIRLGSAYAAGSPSYIPVGSSAVSAAVSVANLMIFKQALSSADTLSIFNALRGRFGL